MAHALALRVFPRIGLLDFPERYGLTRAKIPYPTGILTIVLFLVCFLSLEPLTTKTLSVALAVGILGVFCFIDDRTPLSPALRAALQVLISVFVFAAGTRIYSFSNPLGEGFGIIPLNMLQLRVPFFGTLPLLSGLFTVLWLGLTINALNWFDGIPGQVSTISTIGFTTIGFLSLSNRVQQPELALLSFVLAGLALAGLLFDFPPGRVLMGDTGAMFYGLMLGILTIYSGGKVATAFLVLGTPLIDLFLVVLRRFSAGRSIAHGSRTQEHLHHRLLAKGWSARQIILLTASLGTSFGCVALFLNTSGKALAALLLFLLMIGLSLYSRPRSHRA